MPTSMRSPRSAGSRNRERTDRRVTVDIRSKTEPPNNAMQLTRGGGRRVGALWSARSSGTRARFVRPSQLIASVGWTRRGREGDTTDAAHATRVIVESRRRTLKAADHELDPQLIGHKQQPVRISDNSTPRTHLRRRAEYRLALQRGGWQVPGGLGIPGLNAGGVVETRAPRSPARRIACRQRPPTAR